MGMKKYGAALLAMLGLLTACGDDSEGGSGKPPEKVLLEAHDACVAQFAEVLDEVGGNHEDPAEFFRLGDDDYTLSVSRPATSSAVPTASALALVCVLKETEAPDSVGARLDQTSALSGTQEETWDDITATWTFNGESGFNAVLTQDHD